MKINYTEYLLKNKTEETDTGKLKVMKEAVVTGLKQNGIHGHISVRYFTDGIAQVDVNGEYYNCINTVTGKWFTGYVGD